MEVRRLFDGAAFIIDQTYLARLHLLYGRDDARSPGVTALPLCRTISYRQMRGRK